MRKFFLFVFLLSALSPLAANEQTLVGSWLRSDEKVRYECIDGFKANSGAVLATESGLETGLGSWKCENGVFSIELGWYSSEVTFITDDIIEYRRETFKRAESIEENQIVSIKSDEDAFVETLTSFAWKKGKEGQTSIFRTTFSQDSGVVEKFSVDDELVSFESWAIGSGVLKIGSTTLIDSRVSDRYLIGVDQYDNFVVYRTLGVAEIVDRTDLKEQREAFLAALTTDAWFSVSSYSSPIIFRFRPIESELKGRVIQTRDDKLYSWSVWEYSPEKGTLSIGYTSYIGALLLGDTIAFVDGSGSQQFYRRLPGGANHRFTIADVSSISLSETNINKIIETLSGQFQTGDYLYSFDFSKNKVDGKVHKFATEPFTIIGNTFTNKLVGNAKHLWAIEDVVIFDDRNLLKRDTQKVWLKSIDDAEATALQAGIEAKTKSVMEKNIFVRVRTKDGKTVEVELPISDFSQIVELTLLME